MTDTQIVKVTATPTIPAEIHGFAVTVGIGRYPPDAPQSHRRAVYAELIPITDKTRNVMKRIGRERILATTPLTAEAAAAVTREPGGKLSELLARQTLANAARLAKQVLDT